MVEIFGVKAVGSKLYSDAKLVGLQPSTKKYKDVAPVAQVVSTAEASDPYPSIKPNGLKYLDYIDTVHDINSKLKMASSYPVDLTEIDKKYGDPKPVEILNDKDSDPLKLEAELPSLPSDAVKEELSKVKILISPLL